MLNNGKGLDLEELPGKLQVAEIEEALEAWAMLTQDRSRQEIYEARERARRDTADWKLALQQAEERVRQSYAEGHAEGRHVGELIGQIRLCENLLQRTPRTDSELAAMSINDLRQLAETLRTELAQSRAADSLD